MKNPINIPGIDLSKVTPEMLQKLFGTAPQTAPAPAPQAPAPAPQTAPRKVKTPAPAPQTAPAPAPQAPGMVTPEMLSAFMSMMSGKAPITPAPAPKVAPAPEENAPLVVTITTKDLDRTIGTLNKGLRAHGLPTLAWGSPMLPGEPEGYVQLAFSDDPEHKGLLPETAPWENVCFGLGLMLQLFESPWGERLFSRLTPAPAPKVAPAPAPAPDLASLFAQMLASQTPAPAPAPAPAPKVAPAPARGFGFPKL